MSILALFLLLASAFSSSAIGIDFGDSYTRVSIITDSSPIHIATNSISKRSTPHVIAFFNRSKPSDIAGPASVGLIRQYDWSVGDRARDFCQRYPNACCWGAFPKNCSNFPLSKVESISIYLKELMKGIKSSEDFDTHSPTVFSISPSSSLRSRSLLFHAAKLAGIDIRGITRSDLSIANFYAIERTSKFTSNPRVVAFVDIGGRGSRVSIFNFSIISGYPMIQQIALAFEEGIGGSSVDYSLFSLLTARKSIAFESKKAELQFLSEVSKAKELLTLLNSTVIRTEGQPPITVTREDINTASSSLCQTLGNLSLSALKEAGLKRVDSVELAGGASRILAIHAVIKSTFGVPKIGHTLNAEGASALGCGYFAAEKSHAFDVKPIIRQFHNDRKSQVRNAKTTFPINPQPYYDNSLTKANLSGEFSIIDSEVGEEYIRMKIDTKSEITFGMNNFLCPFAVPKQGLEYLRIGWEIDGNLIAQYHRTLSEVEQVQNERRKAEKAANELEEYLFKAKSILNGDSSHSDLASILESGFEWLESSQRGDNPQLYEEKLAELHHRMDEKLMEITESSEKPKARVKLEMAAEDLIGLIQSLHEIGMSDSKEAKEAEAKARSALSMVNSKNAKVDDLISAREELKRISVPFLQLLRKSKKMEKPENVWDM